MTENPETQRAYREASAILAEHGEPKSYDSLVTMLALAYTKGSNDALTWTAGQLEAKVSA